MLRYYLGFAITIGSLLICDAAFSNPQVPCSSVETLRAIVSTPDPEVSLVQNVRSHNPGAFLYQNLANDHKTQVDFYSSFKQYYRGTGVNKTDREMLRLLMGDRTQEMRSWDYQKLLDTKIANGISQQEAIVQTDLEINKKISEQILDKGPRDYVLNQMMGTAAGIESAKKSASAIPFAPGNIQTAFDYAHLNLRLASYQKNKSLKSLSAYVTVLSERNPRGVPLIMEADPATGSLQNLEYYVLSHVPAQDVSSIYIGYPRKGIDDLHWYNVRVDARDSNGLPSELSLLDTDNGLLTLDRAQLVLRFGRTISPLKSAFKEISKQRPELNDLIIEIQKVRAN